MPRRRQYPPLRVLLNNEVVGLLWKESSGAINFQYDREWVVKSEAVPVSLSLPLREERYRGGAVQAVFENLLPDSEQLRRLVAERVGARGSDAYSLLAEIGRDCVGALQFLPEEEEAPCAAGKISGEAIDAGGIEKLLKGLGRAPLGLSAEVDFRISIAGAQEKTALLREGEVWMKPRGTTPTSHILKRQIGKLPNGMDLSKSVENEYYCLKLLGAFGLPVASAEIMDFGSERVLVVSRFDRKWDSPKRLLRLAQEDCCQALSVPPSLKYQNQGGPGMVEILELFQGADTPREDQSKFIKAQILFWMMGATDGHAKNFSVFLGAGGRFWLTPLYDVVSAQPSVDRRQMERKQMKLAMFVGDKRHYQVDEIEGRHFVQSVKRARLPESLAHEALKEIAERTEKALGRMEKELPRGFPGEIHESVSKGVRQRVGRI